MCQKPINGSFPFIPINVFKLREWKGHTFLNATCSFHLKWVTFWQFISETQVINLRVILHGAILKTDLLKVGHKLLNAQIISQTEKKLDINTFNV